MGSAVVEEYQSLYRKYRPQSPAEVLGQEHVVRALVGAITEGRLAHAFLFCGPRGTGKTSTARILAKMVNCEKAPTSEPCGECEQCLRIRDGNHLDVVEIDAASHGGVDDARELRERAPTAPAMGREKVYILDEAQRLSREAFDALLKLFEEPPPGVRFVLCTTEPHKMPATIIGRCQRFDFRRGTSDVVAEHLVRIAKDEGIQLSQEAAMAMARQTEGSFRDALSLLDQASVIAGEKIDEDVLESLLGAPRGESQYGLADAISVGDTKSVFALIDRLVQEGQDLRHVTAEALKHYRNLLVAQTAPGQDDLLDVPADEYERLRAQATKFTPAELSRIVALLLAAQTDMRWTTSPRLTLELALVRASMPETDPAPEGLISRVERLERLGGVETPSGLGGGPARSVPKADAVEPTAQPDGEPETPEPVAEPTSEATPEPVAEPAVQPVISTGSVDIEMLRRSWHTVIEQLKTARQMVLFASLQTATPATYDGDTLELAFPPQTTYGVSKVEERVGDLQSMLQQVFGISPAIKCVVRDAVGGQVAVLEDDDDGTVPDEDAALERLKSQLNAEIADGDL
ncbi:MAG: DNA polymerase III subunit gamma/tau [Actinomycetota bacterium]